MDLKATTTFDISSYLLFEATGDSEAEAQISDDPIAIDAHDYALALSDDDAQSCCYDQSEAHNVGEEVINGYVFHDEQDDDDDEMKEDSNNHENGNKEACVYGTSYYIEEEDDYDDDDDDDEIQQHHKSTNKPVDSVDEIEKNRRFWEDCLAS